MLFDELPAEFAVDDIDGACAQVAAIEAMSTGTLHAFGESLTSRGADLRPDDDPAGILVIADGLVCQLWLGNEQSVVRWGGSALGPMMEMGDRVFPPPVSAFPTKLFPYIEKRAAVTGRADAKARYHDFLWIHRRSHLDARDAVHAYLRAGVGSNSDDATDHMTAASYLIRAAQISLSLNFERATTAEVIVREMRAAVGEAGGGFVWQLSQHLGALATDQSEAAGLLVDELMAAAEASTADSHRERTMLSAAEAVAESIGRRNIVDGARRKDAESWEREATARAPEGAIIEVALLRDALRAFERLGDGRAIQRLKDRYAAAAARATNDLSEVGVEVQIPNDLLRKAYDHAAESIRAGDIGLLRLPLELGIWPRWEDVRARFDKARQDHPIQWLVSRFTLTPDGRVTGPPEDEADREDAYLHDFFTQEIQMMLGLNIHLIGQLRESGDWSADALIANVRLADDELAAACGSGIRAFEAGDSWTACHVLIPQFERGLRKIALMLSANVRRLVADQGLQVATLGPILADDVVIHFLGANLAQTLVAVFTAPRGLNVRNNTAHGLLAPDQDQTGLALLAIFGVLTAGYALHMLAHAADDRPKSTTPESGAT